MTLITKISIILIVASLWGCRETHNTRLTPLIAKDTTNENERKNSLFVFVGEKISFDTIPYEPGDFDNGFRAKYKILERVYGVYPKETIEFEAYDHYGSPPFANYKHVLMYVSEHEGKYYQEKYMFDDVYITKDGRWAGSYSDEYNHAFNKNTTIKPLKISFVEEVSYPTSYKDSEDKTVLLDYPKPYFRIDGDKAIAVYGNYIEELFKLKKDGVLTARELFGNKKVEDEIKEVQIQNIVDTTTQK